MDDNTCQDCLVPGNGDCADCNGTGKEQNWVEAFSDAVANESQDCDTCHGSSKCQTCRGDGYV